MLTRRRFSTAVFDVALQACQNSLDYLWSYEMSIPPALTRVRMGLVVAGTVGLLASVAVAPASSVSLSEATPDAANSDAWRSPDASVTTRPAKLAVDLGASEEATVVSVREAAGRPVFDSVPIAGKREAKQVIRAKQSDQGTIAVAVEQPQRFVAATSSADPLRSKQWALDKLGAQNAWSITQGAGQTVAVLDTGVSPEPDLVASLLSGWDFVTDRPDGRVDPSGHGTHVAGIIAATSGNGLGTTGLAPAVNVLPVRVLDRDGMGYWSDIAQGIVYATDSGAGVINLSLSGAGSSATMQTALQYAASRDRVLVAAVGNDGNAVPSYPAADPRVVAVSASTSSDSVARFSNYGSYLDLAAPGVGIWSTIPGSFGSESGTSMATPFVSATAALVRAAAVEHNLGEIDVAAALAVSAVDIDQRGRDARSGAGRVDPMGALCAAGACGSPATVSASSEPTVRVRGKSLRVRLNRPGSHEVILKKRMTKRAAKKRYARGASRSPKRGKWRVHTVATTSADGEVRFRMKRKNVYRIVVPATNGNESFKTGKVRRR